MYGMEKAKNRHISQNIIVRKALYLIWQKFQMESCKKIPIWVAPTEAFTLQVLNQEGVLLTQKDLLTKDHTMKDKQDVEKLGLATDWWSMLKSESRYKKDKNMGFFEGKVQVDELWTYMKEKHK